MWGFISVFLGVELCLIFIVVISARSSSVLSISLLVFSEQSPSERIRTWSSFRCKPLLPFQSLAYVVVICGRGEVLYNLLIKSWFSEVFFFALWPTEVFLHCCSFLSQIMEEARGDWSWKSDFPLGYINLWQRLLF